MLANRSANINIVNLSDSALAGLATGLAFSSRGCFDSCSTPSRLEVHASIWILRSTPGSILYRSVLCVHQLDLRQHPSSECRPHPAHRSLAEKRRRIPGGTRSELGALVGDNSAAASLLLLICAGL